jgi:hypothetical protein
MKENNFMKLSKPKVITWWIAVILGGLGILAYLVPIPGLSSFAFWLVAAGFVLLALATYFKDL